MGRHTGQPIDGYSDEFYQSSLQDINGYEFSNKSFAPRPALFTMRHDGSRIARRYAGEPLSEDGTQQIVTDGWGHEHCEVCMWTIGPGDSYWENSAGCILCDECHAFVMNDSQHGKH